MTRFVPSGRRDLQAGRQGYYHEPQLDLYFLRARFYDPATGQFVSEDPKGPDADENLYRYVGNNPVNETDPSGRQSSQPKPGATACPLSAAANAGTLPEVPAIYPVVEYDVGAAAGSYDTCDYNVMRRADTFDSPKARVGIILAKRRVYTLEECSLPSRGPNKAASAADPFGYCFPAGTPVMMADGSTKQIEEIQPGEQVLAAGDKDPEGPVAAKRVVQVYNNQPNELLDLRFGNQVIRATLNHPFYVQGKGWTPANQLQPGDRLRAHPDRWLQLTHVVEDGGVEPVFNLQIADHHTYYVGESDEAGAVLVHNQSEPLGPVARDRRNPQ